MHTVVPIVLLTVIRVITTLIQGARDTLSARDALRIRLERDVVEIVKTKIQSSLQVQMERFDH